MLAVARHSASDGIECAGRAVDGALSVALDLGSVVLGLALRMLVLSGLRPRRQAGEVADCLDDVAL